MSATTRTRSNCARPSAESVLRWMDLMETCEQLVRAGLRRKIGPDGDLDTAYGEWYAAKRSKRHSEIAHMLSRSRQLGLAHGH